jgi:hypothetical protein
VISAVLHGVLEEENYFRLVPQKGILVSADENTGSFGIRSVLKRETGSCKG